MRSRRPGSPSTDIDAVVVNTITGIAVPSLDARLFNRVEFRTDAERLPIFGFGCGGGVAGLSRAARLARSMPGANVLFMTVDLCSLCLRIDDPSIEMFVSAALFGDGAVGVVLRKEPEGAEALSAGRPRVVATGEHLWRDTERIMGWDMKHDGFGVVLSPQLPFLMRDHLGDALTGFLDKHEPVGRGFRRLPVPSRRAQGAGDGAGRARPDEHDLRHSWSVLRDYGNMSSATALFILDEAIRQGRQGPASADRLRSGLLRLFRHPGALSLGWLTRKAAFRVTLWPARRVRRPPARSCSG